MPCASRLLALAWLCACACTGEVRELQGRTMGTSYTVKVVPDRPGVEAAIAAELALTERVFSTWRPDSEISRFNAHRSTAPFAASAELLEVVRAALGLAAKSDGAFDPTVLPLVRAYGFGAGGGEHRASEEEIARARARVGWQKLALLADGRLQKAVPDLELDLDAIAPGWAVDRVVASLIELGVEGCMVEIGGEVRCAGEKAPGVPWTIGIERPAPDPDAGITLAETVELRDAALATSGSYRNQRRDGDAVVHHIFDPRTGRNASHGLLSASVVAPTCMLADGLATALMVVGPEQAPALLDRFAGEPVRVLLQVAREGGVEVVRVRW